MKKGKSNYTLQFICDSNIIDQLMKNYISANGFTLTEKKENNILELEINCWDIEA